MSDRSSGASVKAMMDLIAYADGSNDLVAISDIVSRPVRELAAIAGRLAEAGVLDEVAAPDSERPRDP